MILTVEVLMARGRREGACLVWTGARTDRGYGRVGDTYVHIVMANLVGLPGTGPNVLHTCDNPLCFERICSAAPSPTI